MPTTIRIWPLPIPSKPCPTAFPTWTPQPRVWAGAPGNCAMELLLGFLKNPKYNLYALLTFIEKYMLPLKEQGIQWGYDLQYMFTGQLNRHPREAMEFTAQGRKDYCDFYKSLLENF